MLGEPLDLAFRLGLELRDIQSGLLQQRNDNPLVLLQECIEEMSIVDHGIAAGPRKRGGLLKGFSSLYGESIWLDHAPVFSASYFITIIFFVNRRPSTTS